MKTQKEIRGYGRVNTIRRAIPLRDRLNGCHWLRTPRIYISGDGMENFLYESTTGWKT
jgi:hypothetical protein